MKDKIIEHAKTKFSSSPIEYSDEELNLIIEHSCECDDCGESFFEMDDFPDISIENDEVLCEDCYFDKYRDTCIICEESYEKEDVSDYFFITQKNTKTAGIPVGMYKVVDDGVALGLNYMIYLTAFLSINVGFINILPFPAFDGGRVFFLIVEAIRRKPVNAKFENTCHTIGFILLLLLMFYITIQDLIRLF